MFKIIVQFLFSFSVAKQIMVWLTEVFYCDFEENKCDIVYTRQNNDRFYTQIPCL